MATPRPRRFHTLRVLVIIALVASCSSTAVVIEPPVDRAEVAATSGQTDDANSADAATDVAAAEAPRDEPGMAEESAAEPADAEPSDDDPTADASTDEASADDADTGEPDTSDPADPVYGGLLSWDEIVADRPYLDPSAAEPRDEIVPLTDPISTTRFTTYDRGQLIGGVFESEYPPGALTWNSEVHFDVVNRYAWFGSDGIAEPGDGGCFEFLDTGGVTYLRDSFGLEAAEFTEDQSLGSAFDELDEFDLSQEGVLEFFDGIGVSPTPTNHDNGFVSYRADLADDKIRAAVEEFAEQRGGNNDFQVGRLEIVVDNHGLLFSSTVWARYIGEPRSTAPERRSADSVYSHSATAALASDYKQRTPDQSLLESGYCRPPTNDIFGTWPWVGLIVGGAEITRASLEQLGDGFITIAPDGSFSGSTGCQTFAGTATIGFSTLDDVSTTLSGEPCNPGAFDEDQLEQIIVQILSSDMGAFVSLDGRLFLTVAIDDDVGVLHYRR